MEEKRPVRVLLKKAVNVFNNRGMEPKPDVYGNGVFHGWEDYKSDDYSCKYAIIELEDGKVKKFEPSDIQFTDNLSKNPYADTPLT